MRSAFLVATIFLLFSPSIIHAQTGRKMDITISSAVLKTAEWANFKYMENLDLAQSGDHKGLKAMLEFTGTVDGVEALEHATTCLELIPLATDEKVGSAISSLKPKLKTILLDRFQMAQGLTEKEDLRKPLLAWAPQTWKALHGERVTCGSCMLHVGSPAQNKPGMPATNSADAIPDTEKQ